MKNLVSVSPNLALISRFRGDVTLFCMGERQLCLR